MNLLLIEPEELRTDGTAQLTGRRHEHAREVLRAQEGDVFRVGLRGGSVGTGVVLEQTDKALELKLTLVSPAPPRSGVTLVLAVPRPKAVKRLLPAFASLGLDRVVLLNAARVEKSYFEARALEPATVSRLFDEGLEQGRDTVSPDLRIRERFKPFVEDELPGLVRGAAHCLLCHPGSPPLPRREPFARTVIAIGPEGGWVDFELALFEKLGFVRAGLGARPLRTEIAVPAVLGALGLS
jgi:RsmE family RNA methyltransferase